MKTTDFLKMAVVLVFASCAKPAQENVSSDTRSHQEQLFDDGNYAMFIHFGLYSKLEGEWKGKAYYGNAEWIMNGNQAGIPVDEYMAEASGFNPSSFDAEEIVSIAKDAGMKYIIITSKHHEGFAMFDSEVSDFDIVDATPFGRDVIGELAEACHRNGLGIGFYYSQWQDWTAPGGGNGPATDAEGREVSFDEYYHSKCLPQVEEITTKYGEVQLIWFDTPGNLGKEYSEELVATVKKNQPGALVSSRVGNGLGDYMTLGDMEVPEANIEGRWEGIDVTQVGWGYSKLDNQWKSPEYIVRTLTSTIARGGTFMLNVGPEASGIIHPMAAAALRSSGKWVNRHPRVVYGAGASPWGHALPWGDAVTQGNKIYLIVYDWPENGQLWVPGLHGKVAKARIDGGKRLKVKQGSDGWTCVKVPSKCPDEYAGVVELCMNGEYTVDDTLSVDTECPTSMSVQFAELSGCRKRKDSWMENFGEWKFKTAADNISQSSAISWNANLKEAGFYDFALEQRGKGMYEWKLTIDGKENIQFQLNATDSYAFHTLGMAEIAEPGVHKFELTLLGPADSDVRLSALRIYRVRGM